MINPMSLTYIFLTEIIIVLLLKITGLILLSTAKPRRPADFILINLICTEGLLLISHACLWWDVPPILENRIETVIPWAAYYQTLCMIMLDRVLSVRLHIRYRILVTKRRIMLALLCVWLISILHIVPSMWLRNAHLITFVAWGGIVVLVFIIGYTYIMLAIKGRTKNLSSTLGTATQQNPKYKIPVFIVLSFLLLYLIPMTVYFGWRKHLKLFIIIGELNFIADQITYILGSGRIRKKIRGTFRTTRTVLYSTANNNQPLESAL